MGCQYTVRRNQTLILSINLPNIVQDDEIAFSRMLADRMDKVITVCLYGIEIGETSNLIVNVHLCAIRVRRVREGLLIAPSVALSSVVTDYEKLLRS